MISGQGIIGKLIELLITKIAGRKIDLILDDRKRVCRAFAEYYFCLVRLDELSKSLVSSLRESSKSRDASPFVGQFRTMAPSLDALSQRLLDLGDELQWVVEIYDKTLSQVLSHLYYHKFSLLVWLSHSMELKPVHDFHPKELSYLKPSPDLLSLDMEKYYQWVEANPDSGYLEPSEIDWPIRLLETFGYDEAFERTEVLLTDYAELEKLAKLLDAHSVLLTGATEKLRSFIVGNFKIDEVFSVARHSERDGF